MTLQLPNLRDDNFKKMCRQYISYASVSGKYYTPPNLASQVCSQLVSCLEDPSALDSVISLRETLSVSPEKLSSMDSSSRFGFINNINIRFQGKPLNENLLRLYKLVTKLDSAKSKLFPQKVKSIFATTDQKELDSLNQIFDYPAGKEPEGMSCEDSLRLHLKAFPIFPTQLGKMRRDHLSKLLCSISEQATNPMLTPYPPSSIYFQHLMYLSEYLELPLNLITRSQCVFFLSASYTGMFPRFEFSSELAILLDQSYRKSDSEFLQSCIHNLPRYINLAENTFIPREKIVIDTNKDASEICRAIHSCFKEESTFSESDLTALFLTTISNRGDYFNQFLPRAKFITKIIEKKGREQKNELKHGSDESSQLLPPISVIKEVGNSHDPAVTIKVQMLYSSLIRIGLLLTNQVSISESTRRKRPLSLPKEFVEGKTLEELVPSVSELSAIVSNSISVSECAKSISNRRPLLKNIYLTLATLCDYTMNNSFPNPFSDIPYLLKLAVIASDSYGISTSRIRRIQAYVASSYVIFGAQVRLLPVFSFVFRYTPPNDSPKHEYSICFENFMFGMLFGRAQAQNKESFCRFVVLALEDEFFARNLEFAIKTYSRKSIVEEEWFASISDLITQVRSSISASVGSNLQFGHSIGDGTKYFPFFLSKYIRNIQKSTFSGSLTNRDIVQIFSQIYGYYEVVPDIGSSSFLGNGLRSEFIYSKNTSNDMKNSKFISDELYGLRYIMSHETKLESYPYLIDRCIVATSGYFSSLEVVDFDSRMVEEICKSSFSIPNKGLPPQRNVQELFISFLVNYFSLPQQIVPQINCIFKIVGAFSNFAHGIPSFENSLNFGINIYVLTHGFRRVKDETFGEKCRVAALLSNVVDINTDAAIYDENSAVKTNLGRSLYDHNQSPVNFRQANSLCKTIKQCSKQNLYDKSIADFIINHTFYSFIYEDHLVGNPTSTTKNESVFKESSIEGNFKLSCRVKLERVVERMIEGFEITNNGNKIKVNGIRALESLRLFGVFNDSFEGLLREQKEKKKPENLEFTGLYAGSHPIKGRDDFLEELELFGIETAALVVYKISQSISEDLGLEMFNSALSTKENTIEYCKKHLASVLPVGFELQEINSICIVAFSQFKY
ncbi:hypothetical protein HWI79_2602 [Cryptosporidium felis]|nr:hypothetical protein HWI79_2602 [Cryptosporidium felis]